MTRRTNYFCERGSRDIWPRPQCWPGWSMGRPSSLKLLQKF